MDFFENLQTIFENSRGFKAGERQEKSQIWINRTPGRQGEKEGSGAKKRNSGHNTEPPPAARGVEAAAPYRLEVVASVEFELFRVGQHFQFVKYVVQPRVFRGDIGHGTL